MFTAVTMNGVWKNLCPQFVHNFCGFEVDEESKEVFSNLVTLSEKLELDLQGDYSDFPLLLLQSLYSLCVVCEVFLPLSLQSACDLMEISPNIQSPLTLPPQKCVHLFKSCDR